MDVGILEIPDGGVLFEKRFVVRAIGSFSKVGEFVLVNEGWKIERTVDPFDKSRFFDEAELVIGIPAAVIERMAELNVQARYHIGGVV